MDKERLIQIVIEEVQKELAGNQKVTPPTGRKILITEKEMLQVAKRGEKELKIPKDAIITPFAQDRALEFRIKIIKE